LVTGTELYDARVDGTLTPQSMIALDHVILGVADLDEAAARLADRHRLPSVPGGRHPGWGTQNRIVPLGDAYIELLAVVDREEAAGSGFGSWVVERVREGDGWVGWCVRTDDIDGVAQRLGLERPRALSRPRPDGDDLRWRLVGVGAARRDPALPFFVQWDMPDDAFPGRSGAGVTHAGDTRIAAVEVAGDEHALRHWTGDLPGVVRVVGGPRGVRAVAVAGAHGVEVLR
jgi:Glyoxalase-like domain